MTEVGTRDRWIMAGLVTLGLFTVFAGVLSGQSTINYVLGRDAREAALAWTGEIDEGLRNSTEVTAPRGAGGDIEVLNAVALEGAVAGAGEQKVALPAGPSFRALAVGGYLSADEISGILNQGDVKQALADATRDDTIELTALSGDGQKDLRMAFVPVMQDGKLSRVYAFTVDQAAAASLTKVALTVVTLTTSLLIVMGFSVPAAIASRRIRERWHAEDKIHFLAMHDSLTGLSNRVQFHQHLERAT